MAAVNTYWDTYKCGASLSYPIVKKSPYADWRSLLVRCQVKTASEIFIGALVEQADSGTHAVIEKTSDKSLKVFGIVVDTIENKAQLEIDTGAKATKTAFFAANSYVWVLPLISGFILEGRFKASVSATDEGNRVCSTADGDLRTMAAIATDVDPAASIGRALGMKTNGTGVSYLPWVVV